MTVVDNRTWVLDAAADVFTRTGFEHTDLGDVATVAGWGAAELEVAFGDKAELLAAALEARVDEQVAEVGHLGPLEIGHLVEIIGAELGRRSSPVGPLLLEALAASRIDGSLRELLTESLSVRRERLAGLIVQCRRQAGLDAATSARTVARFATAVCIGALVVAEFEDEQVDEDEWSELIVAVARAMEIS